MQTNQGQFWTAVINVLSAMTVMLILALVLVPGAWAAGKYKILYNFTGGIDGGAPYEGLVLDVTGNLYGTTTVGGTSGNGTVFKLAKNSDGSWTESVLYSFASGTDGAAPWAALTFDPSGNLYGTTQGGGDSSAGTIFQLVPNSDGTWTETVLYSFTGGTDGANPEWCGLIFDATGTLYGMTSGGGNQGMGVVYKLTPNFDGSWTYALIHTFTGGSDGSYPQFGTLAFNKAGNLYGATSDGVDNYAKCPTQRLRVNFRDDGSIGRQLEGASDLPLHWGYEWYARTQAGRHRGIRLGGPPLRYCRGRRRRLRYRLQVDAWCEGQMERARAPCIRG